MFRRFGRLNGALREFRATKRVVWRRSDDTSRRQMSFRTLTPESRTLSTSLRTSMSRDCGGVRLHLTTCRSPKTVVKHLIDEGPWQPYVRRTCWICSRVSSGSLNCTAPAGGARHEGISIEISRDFGRGGHRRRRTISSSSRPPVPLSPACASWTHTAPATSSRTTA